MSVSLSAEPKLVQVKRPVQFNAQLKPENLGTKYRFVFGDSNQTGWQDQSETVHAYDLADTYLAYVDIGGLDNGSFNFISRSARQPIQVNAAPLVSVDLTAEPTKVQVGRPVTFTALATPKDPNTRYRFVFGDGSPAVWQDRSQATHEYATAQTYSVYVEISTGKIGLSGASIRSARKPIEVIAPSRVSVEFR